MKYKEGDKVRIKSLDWYNENKDADGIIDCGVLEFDEELSAFCGKIVTLNSLSSTNAYDRDCYTIIEDNRRYNWTDDMIEGLVEEETKNWTHTSIPDGPYTVTYDSPSMNDSMSKNNIHNEIILPKGYIFKDENGNVINATKIVLEKKKEYPKTYEECIGKLPINWDNKVEGYKSEMLDSFQKLIICRDVYWTMAGEEMGLGKPWELSIGTPIYYIYYNRTVGTIKNDYADDIQGNIILAFPTEEMRDAFKENFDPDIEICKELL